MYSTSPTLDIFIHSLKLILGSRLLGARRKKGRKEGRKEGRTEGRKEGRKEGNRTTIRKGE